MLILDNSAKTDPKFGYNPKDRTLETLLDAGVILVDKPRGPSSHHGNFLFQSHYLPPDLASRINRPSTSRYCVVLEPFFLKHPIAALPYRGLVHALRFVQGCNRRNISH